MFLSLGASGGEKNYKNIAKKMNHRVIDGDKVFVGWNKALLEGGAYFYGFSHIPAHDIHLPASTFKITVFRDPVMRLFSHYKMLLEESEKEAPSSWFKRESKWLCGSFADFAETLPREHLLNQLYMFSPEFDVHDALRRIHECHAVFMTENFDAGVEYITRQIGISLRPLHARKTATPILLSGDDAAAVREMVQSEYELLSRIALSN
tara:strand:- start:209 stop:829 length:621 start_codon:yes stop_codon:yes gene_type:complete